MNFPLNLSVDRYSRLLWSLKFWKKSIEPFSRKWGSKFLGRGTFSSSPTWGAPFPHLTLGDFGPSDPDKNCFCSGGSPPIWGRYGVWPVCTLAHFFSKSASQILDFFCQSQVRTAFYWSWEFKQNSTSDIRANFAQVWLAISRPLWKVPRYNYVLFM